MAAVNRNMFEASVTTDQPHGGSLMVLPLNLLALIISHLDDPGDLARLCRTCRVLNYMSLPQLYKNFTLTSYDKIRYRGEQPEGMGSASPFSMGLNAVITRPYGALVRSLTLRGDWREQDLEEHARVGRVPDSSMMLNIAVRAAVDKMSDLESFNWELSTKMLETVYLGLTQLPKLTSLTIRFPSSRLPRPTIVIPPIPHLRYLKITDIDPLCYPDDISTLLWKCRKLRELNMHWSPRMRNAQEPSVMLHDYFRKCIAARQPLSVRKMGLQNLYALHTEEFQLAFDQTSVEDVTILTNTDSSNSNFMNTFVDSTWPIVPPRQSFQLKSIRQDTISRRQSEFIGAFSGLQKLYFVNETPNPNDDINSPRQLASCSALTPPSLDTSQPSSNGAAAPSTPNASATNSPDFHSATIDSYLNNIMVNHAATLRHLLLPSKWSLSAATIARLVHASPQLEQLAFATELSSMDTVALVLPFLRNLTALRLLVPTGPGTPKPAPGSFSRGITGNKDIFASARTLADVVNVEDEYLIEKLSEAFADQQMFSTLKILGMGRKAFQLGEYYTVSAERVPHGAESQPDTPACDTTTEVNGKRCKSSPTGFNGIASTDGENSPGGMLTPGAGQPPVNVNGRSPVMGQPPRSLLGKRTREDEPHLLGSLERADLPNDLCNNMERRSAGDGRLWRRRVRRVGWDVLKQWEIWGLDTQEL
ncbi:hypothetical protein FE257_011657 [Aspergillus nanangensis]|uniref:F-box domain-containing protein n=1 Tax=Aspergillus nanangensis TaxID=2582783 RepID=A0AAD4GWX4_ASPNN|nr:hypothetical protein FE257_011657 [Aspergillus nanangensis]